jgi:hypothetical protein
MIRQELSGFPNTNIGFNDLTYHDLSKVITIFKEGRDDWETYKESFINDASRVVEPTDKSWAELEKN